MIKGKEVKITSYW